MDISAYNCDGAGQTTYSLGFGCEMPVSNLPRGGQGELTSYSHCVGERVSESRRDMRQKGKTDRLSIDAVGNGLAAIYGGNRIWPEINSLAVVSSHALAAYVSHEIGREDDVNAYPLWNQRMNVG